MLFVMLNFKILQLCLISPGMRTVEGNNQTESKNLNISNTLSDYLYYVFCLIAYLTIGHRKFIFIIAE